MPPTRSQTGREGQCPRQTEGEGFSPPGPQTRGGPKADRHPLSREVSGLGQLSKQQSPGNDTNWPLRKIRAWGRGGAVATSPQVEKGGAACRASQPPTLCLWVRKLRHCPGIPELVSSIPITLESGGRLGVALWGPE